MWFKKNSLYKSDEDTYAYPGFLHMDKQPINPPMQKLPRNTIVICLEVREDCVLFEIWGNPKWTSIHLTKLYTYRPEARNTGPWDEHYINDDINDIEIC